MDEVSRAAVKRVVDAWTIEGNHPPYHRAQQLRLRQEWPALHEALTALVAEARQP